MVFIKLDSNLSLGMEMSRNHLLKIYGSVYLRFGSFIIKSKIIIIIIIIIITIIYNIFMT